MKSKIMRKTLMQYDYKTEIEIGTRVHLPLHIMPFLYQCLFTHGTMHVCDTLRNLFIDCVILGNSETPSFCVISMKTFQKMVVVRAADITTTRTSPTITTNLLKLQRGDIIKRGGNRGLQTRSRALDIILEALKCLLFLFSR